MLSACLILCYAGLLVMPAANALCVLSDAGNLPTNMTERDLEDEFIRFGTLRSVWVARKPPGFGESGSSAIRAVYCTQRLSLSRPWKMATFVL